MLQTSLVLLADSSYSVRVAFSSMPHRAFQKSTMEIIGQVVDKILTINATTEDETMKETLIMTMQSLGMFMCRIDPNPLYVFFIAF